MGSEARLSYSVLKAELQSYRSTHSVAETKPACAQDSVLEQDDCVLASSAPVQKQKTTVSHRPLAEQDEQPTTLPGKVLHSWRFQGLCTLILWYLAIRVQFGAVFFVLAALYWIWTWGTNKYSKPRDPNEPVIRAAFFFDTSPIPSAQLQ